MAPLQALKLKEYDTEVIRELLEQGFTKEELITFCVDTPEFEDVSKIVDATMAFSKVVAEIIGHAQRRESFQELLDWARMKNPAKFQKYENRLLKSSGRAYERRREEPIRVTERFETPQLPQLTGDQLHFLREDVSRLGLFSELFYAIDRSMKKFEKLANANEKLIGFRDDKNWIQSDAQNAINSWLIPTFEYFSERMEKFVENFENARKKSAGLFPVDEGDTLKEYTDMLADLMGQLEASIKIAAQNKDNLGEELDKMIFDTTDWKNRIINSMGMLVRDSKEISKLGNDIRENLYKAIREVVNDLSQILRLQEEG